MTEKVRLGDASLTIEEVNMLFIKSIEFPPEQKPDLQSLRSCILWQGKQLKYKVANCYAVRNRNTQEFHHHELQLKTYQLVKKEKAWYQETIYSFTINDEEDDCIQNLLDFLQTLPHIESAGTHALVNLGELDPKEFQRAIHTIFTSPKRHDLVREILDWIENDDNALDDLTELATDYPLRSKALVAALNYAQYRRALDELKRLVETSGSLSESVFQHFLANNWWMFGSEYSELLKPRELARGIQVDFPLRLTIDGYLEIIEIKTPNADVLKYQRSRGLYVISPDLSEAHAQARHYLDVLDRHKNDILAELGIFSYNVRVRIIIGRNGNAEHQETLRGVSIDRIDIITYDQLIAIAERILAILDADRKSISKS